MKFVICIFLSIFLSGLAYGQLNTTLVSNLDYDDSLNDIWGYAAPDGTEYALVGLTTGLSIVSLADPANPVEVEFISGANSTWRDIKTFSDFAYVSNETSGGLLVVDLRQLPSSVQSYRWQPDIAGLGTLNTSHNLYVDAVSEHLYIAGANLNEGGVLVVDVGTDPYNPQYVGKAPATYAHDVYVRDDVLYASEIEDGILGIYDISDLDNVTLLGSTTTPFNFTHNAWLSSDSDFIFTTDERGNAPVAAYDIRDLGDIEKIDEYRPLASLNNGVIPHNVHVLGEWLVISYYTDGVRIVDASEPDNLIEVGYYDTFFGTDGGFSGVWGAYPFLPSGNLLASDIKSGLYVFAVDYVVAARLEGTIKDTDGTTLNGVEITIDAAEPNQVTSDPLGVYKTGIATTGTYNVTYSKPGFRSKTISVELKSNTITTQNITLETREIYSITGQVKDINDSPIANAEIMFVDDNQEITFPTDQEGFFAMDLFEGDYTVYVGAWGYQLKQQNTTVFQQNQTITFQLAEGYTDDFVLDLGWSVAATPSGIPGQWERDKPVGTSFNGGIISNPATDVNNDIGENAYITGNAGGSAGNDDIDGGVVILTSPVMNLTGYSNPVLHYQPYFFNAGGSSVPNDKMQVFLTNGNTEILLETLNQSQSIWRQERAFTLADKITVTDQMQLRFEASDDNPGHLVEAGVDAFHITDRALAIDVLNFTGSSTVSENLLHWQGTFTNEVSIFEIEKSEDGKTFHKIGEVTALDANQKQSYTFKDDKLNTATNFYRLKIKMEQNSIYSQVIQLATPIANSAVVLFPNPATQQLFIKGLTVESILIKIINLNGRLLKEVKHTTEQPVAISDLPSGLYLLEIWTADGQKIIQQFVKQ